MIDFSSKHDILLRDFDDTLKPMDEPFYRYLKIAENTWQVISDGDYFYVVAGEEEGLCIDGGYGCGNAREFAEQLCQKPVPHIVNTHFHFDHTANNSYFDCAYMSAETAPLKTTPMGSFVGIEFPDDYPIKIIEAGYVFHLGGRDIEVYSFPDHADGSLLFLDRKERLFFVGDEFSDWNKDLRKISVEKLARQLDVMWSHESEYDWCCSGTQIFHKTYIRNYLNNARWILAGHEGVWPVPELEPHAPRAAVTDGDGPVIYERRAHRLPDEMSMGKINQKVARLNGETLTPEPMEEKRKYMRFSDFSDCRIIYDCRKVYEEGGKSEWNTPV